MHRILVAPFLALALMTTAASVRAGDDDVPGKESSRAAFRRGVARFKEGNNEEAKREFLDAYRLFPHPSILLNLGTARIRLGEYLEAEQDFARFIADDGGATGEEVQSARALLMQSRDHLATLKLEVNAASAAVTFDKKIISVTPGALSTVRTTAGKHTLHVECPGYDPYNEAITLSPKEEIVRTVILSAQKGASVDKVEATPAEKLAAIAESHPPASPESTGMSTSRKLGLGLMGGGVLFAGFGTFAGLRAISLSKRYEERQVAEDKSSGITFRTLSDISFVAAIASAGVGAYLFFSPAKKSVPVAFSVAPSNVSVFGRF